MYNSSADRLNYFKESKCATSNFHIIMEKGG